MTPSPKDKLIVALDVDTLEEAKKLIKIFSSLVNIFKVGSQRLRLLLKQAKKLRRSIMLNLPLL